MFGVRFILSFLYLQKRLIEMKFETRTFYSHKTVPNRWITRKHPLNDNPNLLSVNELADKGCCKERNDGIAIATLASIASKVRRDLAQFYLLP